MKRRKLLQRILATPAALFRFSRAKLLSLVNGGFVLPLGNIGELDFSPVMHEVETLNTDIHVTKEIGKVLSVCAVNNSICYTTEPISTDNKKVLPKVTMGWDGNPTIVLISGDILPRKAEMIINEKYYPTGTVGEWPCDPETGEKLEIDYPE